MWPAMPAMRAVTAFRVCSPGVGGMLSMMAGGARLRVGAAPVPEEPPGHIYRAMA